MQTLIFLNGEISEIKIARKLIIDKCHIIAADGGANFLKKLKIIPDLIIGDLDSIDESTQIFFKNRNVKIQKINDQETTDFEKSLMYCSKNNIKDITVFGAASKRSDHTLNNLSVMKRYNGDLNIKLISDEFEIFFIKNKINFKYRVNEIVSLLALPKANNIYTTGLKYPLLNESLSFGVREGALNKSVSDKVSVSFRNGSLLLFKKHFIQ